MVIKSVELKTVCGVTSKLPQNEIPEIAFAGRSNVGKSSLINAIINRKSLARTSSQPGKTQTINFYEVNKEFFLVDLPGYGYAKASEAVKAQWGKMIERYLVKSEQLRVIFLLVDIRHEPTANDVGMYEFIKSTGFKPVIIATKLDKIKRSQLAANVKVIRNKLKLENDVPVIPFSATTKQGREEIYEVMESFIDS
ncbi:MAG: YihA family ribosome biogenesis GTP-binding protein [Lachnospiraceae bacterium]|nr:YihA family ribosome biogenesis GTP-binding protein [Lachnospiraceae bacterium]